MATLTVNNIFNKGDLVMINGNYANKKLRGTYCMVRQHTGIRPSMSVLLHNNLIVDIYCLDLISSAI